MNIVLSLNVYLTLKSIKILPVMTHLLYMFNNKNTGSLTERKTRYLDHQVSTAITKIIETHSGNYRSAITWSV